jgi:hypothetical protein
MLCVHAKGGGRAAARWRVGKRGRTDSGRAGVEAAYFETALSVCMGRPHCMLFLAAVLLYSIMRDHWPYNPLPLHPLLTGHGC